MNSYESKQAAKKAYYADKAEKLRQEASEVYTHDRQVMSFIPFGQPILVGHHSEGRHRRDLARSQSRMQKVIDLEKKANYYERRASPNNHSISSDDEDAVTKLKNKLQELESEREMIKCANREYRKGGVAAVTVLDADFIQKLVMHKQRFEYMYKNSLFPAYQLTNLGGQILQVKKRIAALEQQAQQPASAPIEEDGYRIIEDKTDNRIHIEFDGKPDVLVRQVLKQYGFKWSPTRLAWVRMLNNAGRYAAESAVKEIKTLLIEID